MTGVTLAINSRQVDRGEAREETFRVNQHQGVAVPRGRCGLRGGGAEVAEGGSILRSLPCCSPPLCFSCAFAVSLFNISMAGYDHGETSQREEN